MQRETRGPGVQSHKGNVTNVLEIGILQINKANNTTRNKLGCLDSFLNKSQGCALHTFFLDQGWADIIDLHHFFQESRVWKCPNFDVIFIA